jgi:hypothetical protein
MILVESELPNTAEPSEKTGRTTASKEAQDLRFLPACIV